MHYYTYTHVPAVRQYLYNSLCTCMLVLVLVLVLVCSSASLTMNPKMTVENNAPMNPSHVFLGLSLISGVRPKKNPGSQQRGGGEGEEVDGGLKSQASEAYRTNMP